MPLPSFLVIGAMKAGTTSVAAALADHPEVFMVPGKEVLFFDRPRWWGLGVEWYESRFSGADGCKAAGEASPSYMYNHEAPARMASVVPDAKLVAILRHPVDRAYSHWWYRRLSGHEKRSFRAAMGPSRDGSRSVYEQRGLYLRQLRNVLEHYHRDALHVMLLDDLRSEPAGTFSELCRFLDVDDRVRPDALLQPHNSHEQRGGERPRFQRRGWRRVPKRARPVVGHIATAHLRWKPLDPGLRRELLPRFEEENAALGRFLGRDLSAWSV
jgi:hypothetical protein